MKQTKLILAMLLIAAMLVGGASLAYADSAKATAQGLEETVTVTLTLEDGVITAVDAQTDKEDLTIGRQALEKLPTAMVEQNTVRHQHEQRRHLRRYQRVYGADRNFGQSRRLGKRPGLCEGRRLPDGDRGGCHHFRHGIRQGRH